MTQLTAPASAPAKPPIPSVGHVIWYGPTLPPMPFLTLRTALHRGGLSHVVLHGADPALGDCAPVRALAADPRFRFAHIDDHELFGAGMRAAIGHEARERLLGIYRVVPTLAARADIVRLAILYREGGIYIDADAITASDLNDLRNDRGFAGLERIALPNEVRLSRNPLRWAGAGVLLGLRDVLSRVPGGPAGFGLIQGLYALAANNAVLGAAPEHPLMRQALREAATMPTEHLQRPFAFGPQLFQKLTSNASTADFVLHPPEAFYPLPPEVSWHWFQPRDAAGDSDWLQPQTRFVHLYDTVAQRRLGRSLDARWLLEQGDRTPFGRLVGEPLAELAEVFAA